MRRAHVIKGNKGSAMPRNVFFLDVETVENEVIGNRAYQALRLGSCCRVRRGRADRPPLEEWLTFRRADALWDFVDGGLLKGRRNLLFAHKLIFDFIVADGFAHLIRRGWEYRATLGRGGSLIIKFRRGKTTLLCVDTCNYYHCTVEALGEWLGRPKGNVDFATCSDAELEAYNRRDVEIIRDAMLHYMEVMTDADAGGFGLTLASQAFNSFRHRHMANPMYVHDKPNVLSLERDAYRGGRTECFRLGEFTHGPYYQLDVNSMYAAVMRTHHSPVQHTSDGCDMGREELAAVLARRGAVAEVELDVKSPAYGVISDHGLIFPIGRFRAVLAGPELKYAIAHGEFQHCYYASFYRLEEVFRPYVDFWYGRRLSARERNDPVEEYLAKGMLNSLYGKFAQQQDVWEPEEPLYDGTDYLEEALDYDTGEMMTQRCLCGVAERHVGTTEAWNSMPAVSAYVTAHARLLLWEYIRQAGIDHVYYVDTDSLIVDQAGCDRLRSNIDPDRIGSLKIESISKTITIRALKDYRTDTSHHVKGIRPTAIEVSHNTYEQSELPGLNALLRRRDVHHYYCETVVKRVSRTYLKGVCRRDGQVLPYVLGGSLRLARDGRLVHGRAAGLRVRDYRQPRGV